MTLDGPATLKGGVTLGDEVSDTITFNGTVAGFTLSGSATYQDDVKLSFGTGGPADILWETADANANELIVVFDDIPLFANGFPPFNWLVKDGTLIEQHNFPSGNMYLSVHGSRGPVVVLLLPIVCNKNNPLSQIIPLSVTDRSSVKRIIVVKDINYPLDGDTSHFLGSKQYEKADIMLAVDNAQLAEFRKRSGLTCPIFVITNKRFSSTMDLYASEYDIEELNLRKMSYMIDEGTE